MLNRSTWCLSSLFLVLAACAGSEPDVGAIDFARAGTNPAAPVDPAQVVTCPAPQPGPYLHGILCTGTGADCQEPVVQALGRPGRWAQVGDAVYVHRIDAAASWNALDLLPADGPCALAFDPDALAADYVTPGTCATFLCTLTDGTELITAACH